ncbi:xanthine dehydrogenase subunit D [Neobacillus massiliamazoniensis]|uniref:Xanthine dehydrogenase subunit D n=1 Tax=Neobacillus massiliamazoniensis TaxID=1499688 RepID=A0A0U1P3V3_9BACI|nr:xanthine dehydrogenase subunit D [Neobacillus massiliamazoniensis]CRK84848.1 xanthine dehydrogenase subunit D [Neobacillus massiliamazoniensis]
MYLNRDSTGENWRVRPDGVEKVTGALKYLTDLSFPNMLFGKILRSQYPHARIKSIHIDEAKKLKGVHGVLTYKDIPGLNGFGILEPDQPVFCYDKVRFIGDAVAAVAAESKEIAEKALQLIKVEYEVLPVIDDPEQSILSSALNIHEKGNILHRSSFKKGNIEEGFNNCEIIIEETYDTSRQIHAYMETEGGVVVPNKDGGITVYMGTQHGYFDRFQLSRILNMKENKIRVVSSPMGGSFGGKDELNVQPYGALLALYTGLPVKIHQNRNESIRAGLKRHPMRITMKTGADRKGNIFAHKVYIIADTGAYATLGQPILENAVENAVGPYRIPNIDIEGVSVYTNNGISGEFRGFGSNQAVFALEGQLDRLAEKLNMDPIELREKNIRSMDDCGPLDQTIIPSDGAKETLNAIKQSNILRMTKVGSDKWKRRGVGIAITMLGSGLGSGIPDPGAGRLSIGKDGKIIGAFGGEEVGQGILSVIETLLMNAFNCGSDDLKVVIGDTDLVPHSGSTTASRATTMIWLAIEKMKESFQSHILQHVSQLMGVPKHQMYLGPGGIWSDSRLVLSYSDLGNQLNEPIEVLVEFPYPQSNDVKQKGRYLFSFAAVAAGVEVDLLTGKVMVLGLDQAIAAGPVISPMGYLGQIEGSGVMSIGFSLMEDCQMEKGEYTTENFDTYLIPTICDIPPEMNVYAIETLQPGDSFGPKGIGEIGTVAVAPAIVKAIHDAIGYWCNRIPVSREEILQAVEKERGKWI